MISPLQFSDDNPRPPCSVHLYVRRATAQAALQHAWVMRAQEATSSRALDPDILKSLRDFHHFSELKRAALEAIAFSTSAKAIIEMRRAFQSMDRVRAD